RSGGLRNWHEKSASISRTREGIFDVQPLIPVSALCRLRIRRRLRVRDLIEVVILGLLAGRRRRRFLTVASWTLRICLLLLAQRRSPGTQRNQCEDQPRFSRRSRVHSALIRGR